ncbi:MAG: cysteine hydrolase [Thermomicrobiales bacterium]|nr:cysteine hydrolase [Thermomicrobiales bacterium]
MNPADLRVRNFRLFPADAPLGEREQAQTIDLDRTALLLVDVYHAAADPTARELVHGAWDVEFAQIIERGLTPLLAAARDAGLPVIYAMNAAPLVALGQSPYGWSFRESLGFDPEQDFAEPEVDPLEFKRGELVQLTIPDALKPEPGDYYVRKHTYSGFAATRLETLLRNLDVRTLIVAGFATDCCVLFTIADATFRGFQSILVRDCTLGSELPSEIDSFANTHRTITQIESFLAVSALSADVIETLAAAQGKKRHAP